ncbi:MAG: hypothetical protein QGG40_09675, partial [Myxococcota bacterium]|nr:hypothetical protein [Myxococcota bacterium]
MASESGGPGGLSEQELLDALRVLVGREDTRGVVCLVETWCEVGEVPRTALLEGARALVALGAVNRAWERLTPTIRRGPEDVEPLVLMAEVLVLRGQLTKAGRVLERIRALGATDDLRELEESIERTRAVDWSARQPAVFAGSSDQQAAYARGLIARGRLDDARELLVRIGEDDQTKPWVALLGWGLERNFTDESLEDQVAGIGFMGGDEWDGPELTDTVSGGDALPPDAPTVEMSREGESQVVDDRGFPSLFREETPHRTEDCDDEVTRVSALANTDELIKPSFERGTDPVLPLVDEGGDTEILDIIPSVHLEAGRRLGSDGEITENTDLSWGRPLETEDRDLVDMKTPAHGDVAPPGVRGPIEVIENHPTPVERPRSRRKKMPLQLPKVQRIRGRRGGKSTPRIEASHESATDPANLAGEVETTAPMEQVHGVTGQTAPGTSERESEPDSPIAGQDGDSPATPGESEERSEARPTTFDVPPVRVSRSAPPAGMIRFLVVVLSGLGVLGVTGLGVVKWREGNQALEIMEEVHEVTGYGDYREILLLQSRLAAYIEAGRTLGGIRVIEQALLEAVKWSEFTGDLVHRHEAERLLALAEEASVPDEERALVRAILKLGRGDLKGARSWSGLAGSASPESRNLAVRIALLDGDLVRARDLIGEQCGLDDELGPRHRLSCMDLYRAEEQTEQAEALGEVLLDSWPDHPLVILTSHEKQWQTLDRPTRLDELGKFLSARRGALAPRLEGRIFALRVRLYGELRQWERQRVALRRALSVDPTNPEFLYQEALALIEDGKLVRAATTLDTCLESSPAHSRCQVAQVFVLLDLDRIAEVRDRLVVWAE